MSDARVFFALRPDADTAAAIAEVADAVVRDGRRVGRGRLHLTLAFPGRVNEARLAALCRRAAAVRVSRFTLTLDRIGHFARSRVLWLGASTVSPELAQLASAVSDRDAAGDDREPAFRPHVSLARDASRPDRAMRVSPIAWPVRAFCLIESGRDGAPGVYTRLGCWPLG